MHHHLTASNDRRWVIFMSLRKHAPAGKHQFLASEVHRHQCKDLLHQMACGLRHVSRNAHPLMTVLLLIISVAAHAVFLSALWFLMNWVHASDHYMLQRQAIYRFIVVRWFEGLFGLSLCVVAAKDVLTLHFALYSILFTTTHKLVVRRTRLRFRQIGDRAFGAAARACGTICLPTSSPHRPSPPSNSVWRPFCLDNRLTSDELLHLLLPVLEAYVYGRLNTGVLLLLLLLLIFIVLIQISLLIILIKWHVWYYRFLMYYFGF